MKNIHVLPTDKPSRLVQRRITKELMFSSMNNPQLWNNVNIYITSEEEIKEGDWSIRNGIVEKCNSGMHSFALWGANAKKIILTTDQDLINDGVQAIDDAFLEWFVNNPSCEEVKLDSICKCTSCGSSVKSSCDYAYKCNPQIFYKIIIPKEEPKCTCKRPGDWDCVYCVAAEPKQETLEEAAERLYPRLINDPYNPMEDDNKEDRDTWLKGAKWQQEQYRWKTVYEKTPPIHTELLVKSPEGIIHLASWRESYSIFTCQCKGESSLDWQWKKI